MITRKNHSYGELNRSFLSDQPWSGNSMPSILQRNGDATPAPMKVNAIQSFKIDYQKHKNCQLVDKNGKRVEKYYIKKTKEGENDWYFIASINKEFKDENRREC